jgi:hypothetical protein
MAACQADGSGKQYDSEVGIDPGFKSACAKEIGAQMTASSSPEITYQNLTEEDGMTATVSLTSPTDGSVTTLEYLCIPDGDGEAIADLISD